MNNKDTGFLGENITAQYLTQNGFEILHRNWRYKHLEIDIIAFKDGILHIVEVKTRTDNQFGFPEQAITSKKMQFLKENPLLNLEQMIMNLQMIAHHLLRFALC